MTVIVKTESITWLAEWYAMQCNGDWEHSYGVSIETLDNPGWSIKIDLSDTALVGRHFQDKIVNRSDHDWLVCKVEKGVLRLSCGAKNLDEALMVFRHWVEDENPVFTGVEH